MEVKSWRMSAKNLCLACLGCFKEQPSLKKSVRPLMDPSNIMLGNSMKGQGKLCCLSFHGTPKLCVWGFHERPNTRCLCSASNFRHQKLEVSAFFCVWPFMDPSSIMFGSSMKGQGKFCCSASHGVPKLHA